MEPSNDLDRPALTHGSDRFGDHWYTPYYDDYFSKLRDRRIELLEIGIGGYDDPLAGGASLRMWRDYFPKAHIYGLDLTEKFAHADDRIHIFQGSRSDPRIIVALADATPDDGSTSSSTMAVIAASMSSLRSRCSPAAG